MLQRINILFILLLGYYYTLAQLPDGTIAPDFTLTDINGNTHQLSDYLDEGKTVILEIGATWCEPCWVYTQQAALNEVYYLIGEEGLGETVILFIETEAQNSTDQLMGQLGSTGTFIGDFTFGNWIEAIDYPIIDNVSSINDAYNIQYYPTIYKICPTDRSTYLMNQHLTDGLLNEVLTADCAVPKVENDLAILRYTGTSEICQNDAIYLPIEIINLGGNSIENPMISIADENGTLLTEEVQDVLTPFERRHLNLGPILTNELDFLIELTGIEDDQLDNNHTLETLSFANQSFSSNVFVEILTDEYGHETYWQIQDYNGQIYASGGNEAVGIEAGGFPYINNPDGEGAYASNQMYSSVVQLPTEGCYEFIIVDDYGDGVCCTLGNGHYKIYDEQGWVLLEGGNFTSKEIRPFSVEFAATSTKKIPFYAIEIYPNPAQNTIKIQRPHQLETIHEITIFDAKGDMQLQINPTFINNFQTIDIDIKHLPSGIYFCKINTKNQHSQSLKFSIIR